MPRTAHIDPRTLPDDTPMKLQVLARSAFPDGSVTAAGLRREAEAGRLEIYRIAGVTMTTMAAIRRMVEACRVAPDPAAPERRRPQEALLPPQNDAGGAAAQAALLLKLSCSARPGRSRGAGGA